MRRSLFFSLALTGCIHLPAPVPAAPYKAPEPIAERTPADPGTHVQFLQDGPPAPDQLFVCGFIKPGTFSCIPWEVFMAASRGAGPGETSL